MDHRYYQSLTALWLVLTVETPNSKYDIALYTISRSLYPAGVKYPPRMMTSTLHCQFCVPFRAAVDCLGRLALMEVAVPSLAFLLLDHMLVRVCYLLFQLFEGDHTHESPVRNIWRSPIVCLNCSFHFHPRGFGKLPEEPDLFSSFQQTM